MEKWSPSEFREYIQLDAHARYFTAGNYARLADSVPFRPMVDPDGTLANVLRPDLVHGTDNSVDYLKLVRDTDNKHPSYVFLICQDALLTRI